MASPVSIKTFNVANARGDEMSEDWRFGKRIQYVIDEINKTPSDVVLIQEIRKCWNADKSEVLTPSDIAYLIAKGTGLTIAAFERVGITELAFWRLTLYNSSTLFHLGSKPHWINAEGLSHIPGTHQQWGNLIIESKFAQYEEVDVSKLPAGSVPELTFIPEKTFTVFNVHFPLGREHRMTTSEYIKNIKCDSTCWFALGDMNTFYDDGGAEMIEIMTSTGAKDIAPDCPTFSSFPHDRFQATSRLDHAIAAGDYVLLSTCVYNNKEYKHRPSDHFLCEFIVII